MRSASAAGARCSTVILPSALGGIVTSTVLAVARAAGETAPLILITSVFDGSRVSLQPVRSGAEHPGDDLHRSPKKRNPEGFTRAWGAALVLLSVHHGRQPRRQGAAGPQPAKMAR